MKMMQDKDGNTSSIRAAMFFCVITGCAVAVMGVYLDRELLGLASLVTGLVGAGFAGKAYQKGKE